MKQPSPQALAALRLVEAGRVTWGDPHPDMVRRRHARLAGTETTNMLGQPARRPTSLLAYAHPCFMVDGTEVYGSEHSTYSALSRNGLTEEDFANAREDGLVVPMVLTESGRASLDREVKQ